MKCPIHGYYSSINDFCPKCVEYGMDVIECEIDKISRAIDTMEQQGWHLEGEGSRAILVFRKDNYVPPPPKPSASLDPGLELKPKPKIPPPNQIVNIYGKVFDPDKEADGAKWNLVITLIIVVAIFLIALSLIPRK